MKVRILRADNPDVKTPTVYVEPSTQKDIDFINTILIPTLTSHLELVAGKKIVEYNTLYGTAKEDTDGEDNEE